MSKNVIYTSGIGPFWTIAVESQFYMLWPLVLLACKNNNQRTVVSLVSGLFFSFFVTPLSNIYLGDHYYWTSNNVAELFFGSFLACLYRSGFKIQFSKKISKFAALIFAFAIWFYPSAMRICGKAFYGNMMETFFSVFLVMICVFSEGSFEFFGFKKILSYLGKRSFSFYSVQLTLANIIMWYTNSVYFPKESIDKGDFFLYQFLIFAVLLLAATELLYRLIERPSRNFMRDR